MNFRTFDDNSPLGGEMEAEQDAAEIPISYVGNKGRAVSYLLRNQVLSHTFEEYEVRTTIATRQAWRYRCSVFRRGREVKREFFPIVVDRTQHMRNTPVITEELRLQFAMEAVDIHFSRCAAVQEHLKLTSFYSPSTRRRVYRHRYLGVIALLCVVPLLAYGLLSYVGESDTWARSQLKVRTAASSLWNNLPSVNFGLLAAKPLPHSARWEQQQVSYELPAGERFALLLPSLHSSPEDMPVEVNFHPSSQQPSWLHLAQGTLVISGHVPMTEMGKAYQLILSAKAEQESNNLLQVFLSITEPKGIPASPPRRLSPSPASRQTITDNDCLLKILKDEPC